MLTIFNHSFSTAFRQWKITGIVYFFQLCLAATLGLQIHGVFESSIGNSLEINKLVHQYDHTVISDFLKIHGASITPLIGQLRWLIIVYLLFAVFVDAGLLFAASKGKDGNTQVFWQGGAGYFFPFLRVGLVFLGLLIVWSGLILLPIGLFFQPALEYLSSEKHLIWGVIFWGFVYFLGLFFLFLWSISARYWRIKTGESVISSLKNGWRTLNQNKRHYWGLFGLFFLFQLLLIAIYWALTSFWGMTSLVSIVFITLIQQLFSFFRIMIRQALYIAIGESLAGFSKK